MVKIIFGILVLITLYVLLQVRRPLHAPRVGDLAPDFSLPDAKGKFYHLSDFRGHWVVLYFYPKDDTPVCTSEACSFRDNMAQLSAKGAEVIGISLDTPESHAAFSARYALPFLLLSDTRGETARRYGTLINLILVRFSRRDTFIIDPKGRIAQIYQSVDPSTQIPVLLDTLAKLETPS
ncbi:MAG TPA: peroxiredoxin [Burkholderiales bacterium]|nr:peroxiredoxin [Pseudomonadota bacterium]HVC49265.1 peroxiredoxin [Burkholderiales bacterium]